MMRVTASASIMGQRVVSRSLGSPGLRSSSSGKDGVDEVVMHVAVDVDALDGDAVLAAVEEAAEGDAGGHGVDVGVVVDDERAVAAEFQGDPLEAGVGLDAPADFGAAGEGDDLESVVADERFSARAPLMGRTETDPSGKAGLAGEFGQAEGGERGSYWRA